MQRSEFGWVVSGGKAGIVRGQESCFLAATEFDILVEGKSLDMFKELQEATERMRATEDDMLAVMDPPLEVAATELAEKAVTPSGEAVDDYCERHYQETMTRDENGRYIVSHPFILEKVKLLGSSMQHAALMFLMQERRWQQDEHLYREVRKFFQEYITKVARSCRELKAEKCVICRITVSLEQPL